MSRLARLRHIAVEGPIGVGNSSRARRLAAQAFEGRHAVLDPRADPGRDGASLLA